MAKRAPIRRKDEKDVREWSEKSVSIVGMFTDIFSVVVSIPAIFVIILFLSFRYHLGPSGWDYDRFIVTLQAISKSVHL